MKENVVDVAILCGGRGERLGDLTRDCPKPLMPIGTKCFLDILLEQVARAGFDRAVLCVGYLGSQIEARFRNYTKLKLEFSYEASPLGTGGGLKQAEPHFTGDSILVLNGDSYCAIDLKALVSFHQRHKGGASVTVIPEARGRDDGGRIQVNTEGQIVSFREKQETPGLMNAGIYIFDRTILNDLPKGKITSLERDLFPSLAPALLYAFVSSEPLYDIGTPQRLEQFRVFFANHV